MANDISIKFGVDGESQFKSALSGINSQIKNLGSEMDAAVNSMAGLESEEERAAKKADILARQYAANEEKMKLLSAKYDEAKSNLSGLAEVLERTKSQFGANSTEAAKAEAAYNRQATELNNLGTQMNKTQAEMNRISGSMQNTGDASEDMARNLDGAAGSMGRFGDVLEANVFSELIINGIRKLSDGIKDLAMNAAFAADDIATTAVKTGLTTDAIQEFNYMAELTDTSTDTITSSMAKLVKNMATASKGTGDAAKAFQALGISITNSDGSLRSNQDVFYEVIGALGAMENQTQADAYAMQIFGKSAQDLNPLIATGADGLRALAEEAHNVGYVMSEETINKNLEVSDSYERMRNSITALGQQIGSAFAPVLTSMMEGMTNLVTKITQNKAVFDALLPVVTALAAAMGVFATALAVHMVIDKVSKAMTILNTVLAANPIVLVVAAIAALVTALVTAYNTSETFRNFVNSAFNKVKDTVTSVVGTVVKAVDTIKELPKQALTWGRDMIDSFIQGIKDRVARLSQALHDTAAKVKAFLGFSEPDKGPLSNFHTYAPDMIDLFTKGIYDNLGKVEAASSMMAQATANGMQMGHAPVATGAEVARAVQTVGASAGGGIGDINITFSGSLAQLARMLQPEIEIENIRRGTSLVNA